MTKHFTPDGKRRLLRGSVEDPSSWIEALAKCEAPLYSRDGAAVLLDGGQLIGLNRDILTAIITEHIAVESVRDIGTGDSSFWKVEYQTVLPGETILRGLLTGDVLASKLPRIAGEPRAVPAYLQDEIRQRLKSGEPATRIAEAHKLDVNIVKRLAG